MEIDENITIASRRKFLNKFAYGFMLAMSGCGVETAATRHMDKYSLSGQARRTYLYNPESKTISFEHTHTGEKLKLTYFERGIYIKEALQEINYLLRDFRTDDVHPIDTALLDQLFDLKQTLDLNKPFHIIPDIALHLQMPGYAKIAMGLPNIVITYKVGRLTSGLKVCLPKQLEIRH
jgi:Bacterial protein of unknown function (DUF882)